MNTRVNANQLAIMLALYRYSGRESMALSAERQRLNFYNDLGRLVQFGLVQTSEAEIEPPPAKFDPEAPLWHPTAWAPPRYPELTEHGVSWVRALLNLISMPGAQPPV